MTEGYAMIKFKYKIYEIFFHIHETFSDMVCYFVSAIYHFIFLFNMPF